MLTDYDGVDLSFDGGMLRLYRDGERYTLASFSGNDLGSEKLDVAVEL